MNRKAVEYARDLVRAQGKDLALKIATECEKSSQNGSAITYFNEADFNIGEKGTYEYSKHQSGKFTPNKTRRVKTLQSFWKDVLTAINKGQ